jgi:hypothetical protein
MQRPKLMRGISPLVDWLLLQRASRESRMLDESYEKGIAVAKKRGASQRDYDEIEKHYYYEHQQIWNRIKARRSEKLVKRARKYGVSIPVRPENYESDNNWELNNSTGEWFLRDTAEEQLKREIKVEKRQRDDEIRKWVTLTISIAAFILALLSFRNRQPDPCPKNYYRSNSGECVFALQQTIER